MKTLTLSLLAMGMGLFAPVLQAAPFDHPCEVLYWKMNREDDVAKRELLNRRFSTCVDQFGETDLIKEAKEYLRKSADHEAAVEKKIKEQIEIAKGERSGQIIKKLTLDEIINSEKNPLGTPLVSNATIYKAGEDPEKYETSADEICKYLGYEKGVNFTKSATLDNGDRSDREKMPEEVLELRKGGFFSGYKIKPIVHRAKNANQLDYGIAFSYYTSLTCERKIKKGEAIQNFDINLAEITSVVNSKMQPPHLDDEVARILSLKRSNPKASVVGENFGQRQEDGFHSTKWDNNPFIYSSTIKN